MFKESADPLGSFGCENNCVYPPILSSENTTFSLGPSHVTPENPPALPRMDGRRKIARMGSAA